MNRSALSWEDAALRSAYHSRLRDEDEVSRRLCLREKTGREKLAERSRFARRGARLCSPSGATRGNSRRKRLALLS